MKSKKPAPPFEDPETISLLEATRGLEPRELLELMYGVAAEMVAEGVPSAEIDLACTRVCRRLGIDVRRFMN